MNNPKNDEVIYKLQSQLCQKIKFKILGWIVNKKMDYSDH